jgi:hypothetical protein
MLSNREVGTVTGLALLSLTLGSFTTPPELGCVIGFAAIAVCWGCLGVFRWIRERAVVSGGRSPRPSEPASPP